LIHNRTGLVTLLLLQLKSCLAVGSSNLDGEPDFYSMVSLSPSSSLLILTTPEHHARPPTSHLKTCYSCWLSLTFDTKQINVIQYLKLLLSVKALRIMYVLKQKYTVPSLEISQLLLKYG
jgi:hypothetical protein